MEENYKEEKYQIEINKFMENNNEADYKAFLKKFSVKLDEVTKDSLYRSYEGIKR